MRRALPAVIVCLWGTSLWAERPVLVGEHGDPSRLVIEGCEHYTADSIRRALASNLDLVIPSRPSSSLTVYEQTLQSLISDGYRASGFAEAIVAVSYEQSQDKVVVRITEGRQYRCGEIRITGVSEDVAELLRRALLEQSASSRIESRVPAGFKAALATAMLNHLPNPSSCPEWEPGKLADFRAASLRQLHALVERVLNDAGWWKAQFTASLEKNKETSTAALAINVINPGRQPVISDILIEGQQRDSRDSILAYLDLHEGMPYPAGMEQTLATRLWDSGRYRDAEWSLESNPDDSGSLSLRLRVWELPSAPPLDQPLDEVDQILVKAAHWLSQVGESEFDVAVRGEWNSDDGIPLLPGRRPFKSVQWEFVISGQRGYLLQATLTPADGSAAVPFALAIEPERLRFYSGLTHRDSEYPLPHPVALRPWMRLQGQRETGSDGKQVALLAGLWMKSARQLESPAFTFLAAPVVLFDARYRNRSETTLQNGRLTLESNTVRLTIDQESGQVIEWEVLDQETREAMFTIQTGRRALDQKWTELSKPQTDHDPGSAEPAAAEGSGFWTDEVPAALGFLGCEVDGGARIAASSIGCQFQAWFRQVLDKANHGPHVFGIPTNDRLGDDASRRGFFQAVMSLNSVLFPPASRPARLVRELYAGMVLHDPDVPRNLQTILESPDNGPLMYGYAAEIFRLFNPPMAKRLAAAGLGRLETDRFLEDVAEFAGSEELSSSLAADVLTRLRGLSQGDRDALLALIGDPAHREQMAQIIKDESQPMDATVNRLLEQFWEAVLRDLVRARLNLIRGAGDVHTTCVGRAATEVISDNAGG